MEYADRSQHARIHAIENIVKDLRDSYDPFWKPDMLAVDQRAIFAISSSQISCRTKEHYAWLDAFVTACEEQGVDLTEGGDHQKRLVIYRRMPPLYKEGLSMTFHHGLSVFELARTPADFERDNLILAHCHACGRLSSSNEETLKLCSRRCKTVRYCSKQECYANDWPDHKRHCKILVELRNDKA
jgi:hypothetical protein